MTVTIYNKKKIRSITNSRHVTTVHRKEIQKKAWRGRDEGGKNGNMSVNGRQEICLESNEAIVNTCGQPRGDPEAYQTILYTGNGRNEAWCPTNFWPLLKEASEDVPGCRHAQDPSFPSVSELTNVTPTKESLLSILSCTIWIYNTGSGLVSTAFFLPSSCLGFTPFMCGGCY